MGNIIGFLISFGAENLLTGEDGKKEDIEKSKSFINYINNLHGTSYVFIDELDIKRNGGDTPPQPEAIFRDDTTGKQAVVELKTSIFGTNKKTGQFYHKLYKIFNYLGRYYTNHKLSAKENHRNLFVIDVHDRNFNPTIVIKDLTPLDLFESDYKSTFLTIRFVDAKQENIINLPELVEGQDVGHFVIWVLYEGNENITIEAASTSNLINNYETAVNNIIDQWREDDWGKKFEDYKSIDRYLVIELDMNSPFAYSINIGQNTLLDFVEFMAMNYLEIEAKLFSDVNYIYFITTNIVVELDTIRKGIRSMERNDYDFMR